MNWNVYRGGICPSEKEPEESHELEVGLVGEILSIILFLLSFQQQSAAVGEIKVVFRLIRTAFEKKMLKFISGQSWENIKFFMKDIMTLMLWQESCTRNVGSSCLQWECLPQTQSVPP